MKFGGRKPGGIGGGLVALAGLAVAMAGCTSTATPSPSPSFPPVRISNQTTVAVTLVVNGSPIAALPAGSLDDPVLTPFPARPWAIRIQSPSGRTLVTLDVPAGDITVGLHGSADNLACGVIELAVADPLPAGGPAHSPGPDALPCD